MNKADKLHCPVYLYESTECIFVCTIKPSIHNAERHTIWNNVFYHILMFSNSGHHHLFTDDMEIVILSWNLHTIYPLHTILSTSYHVIHFILPSLISMVLFGASS
jgi:hypothetical protein